MIQLRRQQHIRFAKVEQPQAWLIVAVLVETEGNETIAVSEPKVVKIIPKALKALQGFVAQGLYLSSPCAHVESCSRYVSPYFSRIFNFTNSDFDITQSARPPTNN